LDKFPLVTIGVASYNNAAYILETLNSIKKQTYQAIELIIVDDCSSDNSIEVIQSWMRFYDNQVKLISNSNNKGIPFVCNTILFNSSKESKYLILIGSDDMMSPERVSLQVSCFERQLEKVAVVFSDMIVIDDKGKKIYESYYDYIGVTVERLKNLLQTSKEEKLESLLRRNDFPAPSMIFRKQILIDLGGWDEQFYFEDWPMNLRLINGGFDFICMDEKLVEYRKLIKSASSIPNPKYYESILSFVSEYRNINSSIDSTINSHIKNYSILIYKYDGKQSKKWLIELFKLKPSFKTFLFIIFSFFKMPYSAVSKFATIKRMIYQNNFTSETL